MYSEICSLHFGVSEWRDSTVKWWYFAREYSHNFYTVWWSWIVFILVYSFCSKSIVVTYCRGERNAGTKFMGDIDKSVSLAMACRLIKNDNRPSRTTWPGQFTVAPSFKENTVLLYPIGLHNDGMYFMDNMEVLNKNICHYHTWTI